MRKLFWLVAVVLVGGGVVLLSGCGGDDSAAPEEPPPAVETVPSAESESEAPSPVSPEPAVENGKIAFATDWDGVWSDLYVVESDGSDVVNMTSTPDSFEAGAAWSGDGTMIAFIREDVGEGRTSVYTMRSDGTEVRRITDEPGFADFRPSFSPDGSQIAFARHDLDVEGTLGDIYLVSVISGALTQLTDDGLSTHPDFSPDGSKIVYTAPRDPGLLDQLMGQRENLDIWLMNADGSDKTRLTDDDAQDERPHFSPDGSKIVFASNRDGDGSNFDIFVMNADGSDPVNITNSETDEGNPVWSPDGKQIAFVAPGDGREDIAVMDTNGSNQTVLVEGATTPPFVPEPAWQPLLPGVTPLEPEPEAASAETDGQLPMPVFGEEFAPPPGELDPAVMVLALEDLPEGVVVAEEGYTDPLGLTLATYVRDLLASGASALAVGGSSLYSVDSTAHVLETEAGARDAFLGVSALCESPDAVGDLVEEYLEAGAGGEGFSFECSGAETIEIEDLGERAAGARGDVEATFEAGTETGEWVFVSFQVGRTFHAIYAIGSKAVTDDIIDLARIQAERAEAELAAVGSG